MKVETKQRKRAMAGMRAITGEQKILGTLVRVINLGKRALDGVMLEMGRMFVESIMLIEREELAGPDYYPTEVPGLLRKTLMSTNPIESMFSLVRHSERNIKRSRGTKMLQRWLGSVLLYCEGCLKGFEGIAQVIVTIEAEQAEQQSAPMKQAA